MLRLFLLGVCLAVSNNSAIAQSGIIATYAGPSLPVDGTAALTQALDSPAGIALDGSGGFYITSSSHNKVYRVTVDGLIATVAGNGSAGFSGDGGPAQLAQLNKPQGIAVDAAGNLFVADTGNNRIRKIAPSGTISTAAGNGSPSSGGDGGFATFAGLWVPKDVAVDTAGNFYIADSSNSRIRKVSPAGVITTVAGTGNPGYNGDGISAITAQIGIPNGVFIDGAGNLIIADNFGCRIRKVTPGGIISTVAGTGTNGFGGESAPATSALLSAPERAVVDTAGNMYIVDRGNQRIRKVTPAGIITTLSGNGLIGNSGDGGQALFATFSNPIGITTDAAGNVFVADTGNGRIRRINTGNIIDTIIGIGTNGFAGDNGPATSALLRTPFGVAVDAAGNVFVADRDNGRVRKVSPSGVITTIAGNGQGGNLGDGGPATAAVLINPTGLAMDSAGNLFIADSALCMVRKVSVNGIISRIAGNGVCGFSGDGGLATSTALNSPYGITLDSTGNLFIADYLNSRVRKVTPGGTISTVAGNGLFSFSGDGGVATSASLNNPSGVAVDAVGNLYIADERNRRVRKVTPAGVISTFAGSGGSGSAGDGGAAAAAQFGSISNVVFDNSGNLFITDGAGNSVRKVTPGGLISTIAGTGVSGFSGDAGPARFAQLNGPQSIAVDGFGNLIIAEAGNHRIRIVGNRTARDFNSDSKTDILWRDVAGNVSMWLLNGYTVKSNSFIANIWTGWSIVGNGDFNGDGKTDILWRDGSGQLAIWLMNGATVTAFGYPTAKALFAGPPPTQMTVDAVADFNGDGKADILFHLNSGAILIWTMDGFVLTNSASVADDLFGFNIAGVADFDGDGGNDILLRDSLGNVSLWLMNGTVIRSISNLGNIWPGWRIVGTGDFDGNGRADILWRDIAGNVAVWLMNGSTVVNSTLIANIWLGWSIAGTGDFNGDGMSDILWRDVSGNIAIWLMNGNAVGSFGAVGNMSAATVQ